MKKEDFLKLGLSDELANKAAEASAEELKGFIPKSRFDEANEAKKQLEKDIAARDTQLEALKKVDAEGLKVEIERLQSENKSAKEKFEGELKQLQINNAVEKALIGAKAKNVKAVKALLDLNGVEFDGETVKGLADQLKKLQEGEDSKFLFDSQGTQQFKGFKPSESGDRPPSGNNPWSKEYFNLTEQGKMLKENPELAAQMMTAKN